MFDPCVDFPYALVPSRSIYNLTYLGLDVYVVLLFLFRDHRCNYIPLAMKGNLTTVIGHELLTGSRTQRGIAATPLFCRTSMISARHD